MMTDCPNAEIRDLLPDYVHGTLAGAQRAVVESHLAACADCADEVALLRAARQALAVGAPTVDVASIVRALPAPPVRTAHTPGVVPISAARGAPSRFGGWRRAATVGLVAAGVAAVAVVGERERGTDTTGGATSTVTQSAPALGVGGGAAGGAAPVVAEAPRQSAPDSAGGAVREPAIAIGAGVSDLSDDALATLVGELDDIDAVPATEPAPLLPNMTGEGTI